MPRATWPTAATLARRSGDVVTALRGGSQRWLDAAVDVVFPPYCLGCDESLGQGSLLCDECKAQLVDSRPRCAWCGAALAGLPSHPTPCAQCAGRRFQFEGAVCLGEHRGGLREAVLAMKRPAGQGLAMAVGRLMCKERRAELAAAMPDAVMPVPMHWTRRIVRGANSAETLARTIARELGVVFVNHLLKRSRVTQPQAPLSPERRRQNVRGAFCAKRHKDLAGARVLLVDDVLTTGATCHEAAKALRQAGAAAVVVAVVARGIGT